MKQTSTRLRAAMLAAMLACVAGVMAGTPEGLDEMRAFAKTLLVTERYEDAIATYVTIAQQTPNDPRSHYEVAGAMVFLRMWPQAIPYIERAIALDAGNALYHELAAMTYLQMQDFPRAFEATRRGAELGDVNAMYALAGMYEHGRGTARSDAKALEWLERAARAGHMSAMDAMARVYRDGLYGEPRDAGREAGWRRALERAMAR